MVSGDDRSPRSLRKEDSRAHSFEPVLAVEIALDNHPLTELCRTAVEEMHQSLRLISKNSHVEVLVLGLESRRRRRCPAPTAVPGVPASACRSFVRPDQRADPLGPIRRAPGTLRYRSGWLPRVLPVVDESADGVDYRLGEREHQRSRRHDPIIRLHATPVNRPGVLRSLPDPGAIHIGVMPHFLSLRRDPSKARLALPPDRRPRWRKSISRLSPDPASQKTRLRPLRRVPYTGDTRGGYDRQLSRSSVAAPAGLRSYDPSCSVGR